MAFTNAGVPDQSGKTIIVTGANTGIGFEAAKVLAAKGARILLACRDGEKAEGAKRRIGEAVAGADIDFLSLDLGDLQSIRRAAEKASKEQRIDVLINNAGVAFPPLGRTREGFELQFGVNHLGTFALTSLLLSKLAETSGSRVVLTSSHAHKNGTIQWDDLNAHKSYGRIARYCDSKFATMLYLAELDRRLRAADLPVTAVGCHPGVATTEVMRHSGPFRVLMPAFKLLLNSAMQGAWPALQAATAAAVEPGGYYGPQGVGEMKGPSDKAKRSAQTQDAEQAKRLWEVSVEMTGIDPGLQPA